MKDYKKKLAEYGGENFELIQHEWKQNAANLYNEVAKRWNKISVGQKIIISSYKRLGVKSAASFLKARGLNPKVVGKGPDNLRLVEVEKDNGQVLPLVDTKKSVSFSFDGHTYNAYTGDTTFSKTGLDAGTRFLLETFFAAKVSLSGKRVADAGSGWGAVALVLAHEFQKVKIVAYENDEASLEVLGINTAAYPNLSVVNLDLTEQDAEEARASLGKFDYIISNPPFHAKQEERILIFHNLEKMLNNEGELFFVAEGNFVGRFREAMKGLFVAIEESAGGRYIVFRCRKLPRGI